MAKIEPLEFPEIGNVAPAVAFPVFDTPEVGCDYKETDEMEDNDDEPFPFYPFFGW